MSKKNGNNTNGQRSPKTPVKAARALQLRLRGKSYDEIAEKAGYANRSNAHRAVSRELEKRLDETAPQVRKLELARLDRLLTRLENIMGEDDNLKVEAWHFAAYLKIMDRRAAYLGIDAAQKLNVTSGDGIEPYELAFNERVDRMRQIFDRARARRNPGTVIDVQSKRIHPGSVEPTGTGS